MMSHNATKLIASGIMNGRILVDEVKQGRLIQSMARAAKILEHLAYNGNSESLSSISRALNLNKSTVYTLISTWEQLGYVQQNQDTGKYSLGLKVFELGQVVQSSMDLRTEAMPFLRELAAQYGETVHLAVLSDGEVVYVDKVDSPRSIRIVSRIGGRNPAHCTGVGKVLLAGLSDSQLEKVIGERCLRRFTENTIIDPDGLKRYIHQVSEQGYALDQEEFEIGLFCVAAPIKNHQGVTIAAISISGPADRMKQNDIARITSDLKETAKKISSKFAYFGQM
jgi:DNA-binding IclR family transcriptional regulator